MDTVKYVRKPFYVEALQVTAENIEAVAEWCSGEIRTTKKPGSDDEVRYIKVWVQRPLDERQTMAFEGDWLLYAGTGFKVYMDKAFQKSFEKVVTPADLATGTS